MASPTPNKGYTYPAHGGAVNAWDTPINADFDQIDLNVGGTYNINCGSSIAGVVQNSTYATVSSTVATATLSASLAQNMHYYASGALTADLTVTFPAVGSFYVLNNATTGGFNLNAVTAAGGSTTISVGVGGKQMIVTDGTNPFLVGPFESGTRTVFQQDSAPAGWTKDTGWNNYALRLVSGTVSNGGSLGFTTAFSAANTTSGGSANTNVCNTGCGGTATVSFNTHTHTVNINVHYLDFIIAQKD